MFQAVVNSLLILSGMVFFAACSSEKEWDPKTLENAMATMEREKKVDYSPTAKADEKDRTFFQDQSIEYGLGGISASSIMAVELNGDEYTDLVFIEDYFSQPIFYLYNPKSNKFEKGESRFDDSLKASYILFFDIDGDKITDALAGVLNQGSEVSERPIRFMKGYKTKEGLRFKSMPGVIPLSPGPSATLGLVDFDVDGDLDIFVGNWFSKRAGVSLPEKDYLLEYKNGKYVDASDKLEGENELNSDRTMHVNAAPTFSSQICDIDLNGFPDILATSTNGYLNKLWMNRYTTRTESRYFKNFGTESSFAGDPDGILNSRGGGRSFSTACADYNHDGIMDAFLGELSHNHDADSIDKSSILTGSTRKFPPKFLRTEYVLDAHDLKWNQSDKRGVWFDYNNDGLLDLWVDNSGYPPHTRSLLFKQYPDHSFENVAKQAGVDIVNPHSSILIDVNRDGKMDVLTAQSDLRDARIKKRLYLFVNKHQDSNRSVRIYPRGNRANFSGLGSTIEVKVQTKNGIERRIQATSYSYGGLNPQNEEGVLFGLKEGDKLLSAKIIWPYSKSKNSGRASMEKFYDLRKFHFGSSAKLTLCEVGISLSGNKACPIL